VLVFRDESGASLLPVVRRTWAPRGHTPVIRHHFKWKRASMATALCYGPNGGGAAVCFHHQEGADDTGTLIGALEELRGFLAGQKATLVWDGLPGYAPELNPVEGLWANLKGVELANLAADALEDIVAAAERGIQRIRATHGLASSFLRHCGLSL
jgi:hypothetical protein